MVAVDLFPAVPGADAPVLLAEVILVARDAVMERLSGPAVMAVGEIDRRIEVRPVLLCFGVRCGGIQGKNLLCKVAEVGAHLLFVVFQVCLFKEDKRRTFVGVEAVENGLLVMVPLRIGFIRRHRQHVSVHHHVVHLVRGRHQFFRVQLPQFLHAGYTEARKSFIPGLDRPVQQAEGVRRPLCRRRGTLADRAAEQSFCQGRCAERAHTGRTR